MLIDIKSEHSVNIIINYFNLSKMQNKLIVLLLLAKCASAAPGDEKEKATAPKMGDLPRGVVSQDIPEEVKKTIKQTDVATMPLPPAKVPAREPRKVAKPPLMMSK